MKTLLVSALGGLFVTASFLAGATWAASSDAPEAAGPAREVTVYSGTTAITLPAAVLAQAPAFASPALAAAPEAGGGQAPARHVRVVLQSPYAKN